MKLEFPGEIFEKYRYQILSKSFSGSRVPWGRTDRHDKADSRISRFCEAPRKVLPRTRIRVPDRLGFNTASMPNALLTLANTWLMFLAPLVSQQVLYIFFPAQYSFPLRCSLSHCAHFQDVWLLMRSLHTIVFERINWIPCVHEVEFHSVGT